MTATLYCFHRGTIVHAAAVNILKYANGSRQYQQAEAPSFTPPHAVSLRKQDILAQASYV